MRSPFLTKSGVCANAKILIFKQITTLDEQRIEAIEVSALMQKY